MLDETVVTGALRFGERRVRMRLLALVLLIVGASPAMAQVVRGTIRDAESGAALAGVVVTLLRATPATAVDQGPPVRLAATLSDAGGEYALAAGESGRVMVTAKRIGVRQFQSGIIALAAGATHRLDITLEGVRFELPVVTVSAVSSCGTRDADRGRIASLWAEASAALTASELSLRDRLFRATVQRYRRVLEPRALAVRSESREAVRTGSERAFVSIAAESLAAQGYARILPDGMIEHFAPDERVLLSDTFVRDHCFGLAPPTDTEVGVTFTPVRQRRATDIEGTIWLDARSFELRRVAFRYTNFPLPVVDARTGGEVHFQRLENGAWYVSRWFMRTPRAESNRTVGSIRAPRATTERVVIVGFNEVGGQVQPDGRPATARLATLTGLVVDSTGHRALPGARVSLEGMSRGDTSGSDGAFRLDSIPRGTYTLLVEHAGYDRLGMVAAEQLLEIAEGSASVTLVEALGSAQILRQLCGYDVVPDSIVALRLVLPPGTTSHLDASTVHLTWQVPKVNNRSMLRLEEREAELPIDTYRGATACQLPRETRLRVEERGGGLTRWWEIVTPTAGFSVVELRE
jgi:hypothetical protein